MKPITYLVLLLAAGHSLAEGSVFTSGPEQVDLIELYTSEGCSSCPPADRRMNNLANNPGLWKTFVPVAFHVDYWNYIGWKDPFSSPGFSARQRTYSKEWRARQIFTPCFVVNGTVEADIMKRRSAEQPGVLRVSIEGEMARVSFTPTRPSNKALTAWIAPLSGTLSISVTAGENRGRKLEHNFVALGLDSQTMESKAGVHSASLPFPENVEVKAVAVWIAEGRSLAPIQTAGGVLEQ